MIEDNNLNMMILFISMMCVLMFVSLIYKQHMINLNIHNLKCKNSKNKEMVSSIKIQNASILTYLSGLFLFLSVLVIILYLLLSRIIQKLPNTDSVNVPPASVE